MNKNLELLDIFLSEFGYYARGGAISFPLFNNWRKTLPQLIQKNSVF